MPRVPLILAAAIATRAVAYLLGGQGLGGIGGSAGAAFALLGAGALYLVIVAMITRGPQLTMGAIGAAADGFSPS